MFQHARIIIAEKQGLENSFFVAMMELKKVSEVHVR
jgi:hypothetical protein